jgi:hypothetical protein
MRVYQLKNKEKYEEFIRSINIPSTFEEYLDQGDKIIYESTNGVIICDQRQRDLPFLGTIHLLGFNERGKRFKKLKEKLENILE